MRTMEAKPAPKPTWQPIRLVCLSCHDEWQDWQPCGVRLSAWVFWMQGIGCPVCRAGKDQLLVTLNQFPAV